MRALLRLHAAEESTRAAERLAGAPHRRAHARPAHQRAADPADRAARARRGRRWCSRRRWKRWASCTGSIAHDFNNILASMMGWIHVVRHKSGDADIVAMLDKALNAGDRGKRLTLRLLSFSRSDTLVTGSVDARALLMGMREWLQQTRGRLDHAQHLHRRAATWSRSPMPIGFEAGLAQPWSSMRVTPWSAAAASCSVSSRLLAGARRQTGTWRLRGDRRARLGCRHDAGRGGKAFDPFSLRSRWDAAPAWAWPRCANLARLSSGAARIVSDEGSGTIVTLWLAAGDRVRRDATRSARAAGQPDRARRARAGGRRRGRHPRHDLRTA